MEFEYPLISGKLLKRYKRFLTDVETTSGDEITIHCPNTGSMRHCLDDVKQVWYWDSGNPKRKYAHTFELVETNQGHFIGVNTGRANALVKEALERNKFPILAHDEFKSEVRYGEENSRIDFLLRKGNSNIWVEVKSVTLLEPAMGSGHGCFPDAVSSRGTKHLRELTLQVQQGDRAVLLFCVQHTGIKTVSVADHIDPTYAEAFKEAVAAGVEVIALGADITTGSIELNQELEVL